MLYSGQIRAARGFLRISAVELAELSGTHPQTIHDLEKSQESLDNAKTKTLKKIKSALEKEGIEFLFPEKDNDSGIGAGIIYNPK